MDEKLVTKFKEITKRYPDKKAALLQLLHLVQKEFGFVSEDKEEEVANFLGISPARVHEVLTFYTMYHKKPVGKYHIQVCQNISCSLLGAKNIIEYLTSKLLIKPGETTPDKKFSLSTVECLGSCGTAPVMKINDEYYENLTEERISEILDSLE